MLAGERQGRFGLVGIRQSVESRYDLHETRPSCGGELDDDQMTASGQPVGNQTSSVSFAGILLVRYGHHQALQDGMRAAGHLCELGHTRFPEQVHIGGS